jgi:oligoribonuclease
MSDTTAAPTLAKNEQNLIWIDLEMTGLKPDSDRIIEIAVVVTDANLSVRMEGPVLAIHQSDETVDEATASKQVIDFLKTYVGNNKSPMCGNSICQDRRFLANYMPELEAFFHYRNLDVSTLKELAKRWKPGLAEGFKKAQAHTALADIHESIDELAYYREHFLVK